MKNFVLLDGQFVDPVLGRCESRNFLFTGGKLVGMGYVPDEDEDNLVQIDCKGCIIVPNILDMWANFREPGGEDKETISSGSLAALKGGVPAVLCSPYTPCPIDTPETVSFFKSAATRDSHVNVYPAAALTRGLKGEQLAEVSLMQRAGAVAVADDAAHLSSAVLKNGVAYAAMTGQVIIFGANSRTLATGAAMNEGEMATILGLKGISASDEALNVERVLVALRSNPGARVHFSHVSTVAAVDKIRQAKAEGLAVTCGTSPIYFNFTQKEVEGYNTSAKVNPPLRTDKDVEGILMGIKDGTIDVIASHHLPCTIDEKRTDFQSAEFGVTGIDLLIPLVVTKLIKELGMDMPSVFEKLSKNPYDILGLDRPKVSLDQSPSFSVINMAKSFEVTAHTIHSHGKHTPFMGQALFGVVEHTIIDGELRYSASPVSESVNA
ncbi:MAG: dihydroorotase [bacterium]|nr:dihydroorotase [bacterium]